LSEYLGSEQARNEKNSRFKLQCPHQGTHTKTYTRHNHKIARREEDVNSMEVKQMPYEEKYRGILDEMKMCRGFVLPIVKKDLGVQKAAELEAIWKDETKLIRDDASCEEKFEIVYGNWTRRWTSAYNFVEANLGEKGIEEFKREAERANIEAVKRKAGRPALLLLKLMRAVSPSTAFRTLARQLSYQLQVFTPFTGSELSGNRLVLDAHPCMVADQTNSGALCTVGCQQIYRPVLKETFGVSMAVNPQGKNCTITFTPT